MAGNVLAMSDQGKAQEKRKAQWRQEGRPGHVVASGLGTVSGDVVADGDSEKSGE